MSGSGHVRHPIHLGFRRNLLRTTLSGWNPDPPGKPDIIRRAAGGDPTAALFLCPESGGCESSKPRPGRPGWGFSTCGVRDSGEPEPRGDNSGLSTGEPSAGVTLGLQHPPPESSRRAAVHGGDSLDGLPPERILVLLDRHPPNGPLMSLWGVATLSRRSPTLSNNGASGDPWRLTSGPGGRCSRLYSQASHKGPPEPALRTHMVDILRSQRRSRFDDRGLQRKIEAD